MALKKQKGTIPFKVTIGVLGVMSRDNMLTYRVGQECPGLPGITVLKLSIIATGHLIVEVTDPDNPKVLMPALEFHLQPLSISYDCRDDKTNKG